MATLEGTNQALANQKETEPLVVMIEKSAKELARALPDHLKPERLVRIALTCIRQNPELSKCTPASFLGALFTAAQVGVEPINGRAYLLPFNNSKKKPDGSWHTVKECQFVMGYKGLVDLFYNHEKAVNLEWGVVKVGDAFDFEKGTRSFLSHRENKVPNAETRGFWVMANLANGGKPFHYMTHEECMAHGRQHSKTWDKKAEKFYDKSPWATEPDAMCLKTVLAQLCKILPLSVELQRAIANDESARDMRGGVSDVLNIPSQVNWDDVEKEVQTKQPPTEDRTVLK